LAALAFTVRVDSGHSHKVYPSGPYEVVGDATGAVSAILLTGENGAQTRLELAKGESAFIMNSHGWTVEVIRNGRAQSTFRTTQGR
jgi:hypothetical protein